MRIEKENRYKNICFLLAVTIMSSMSFTFLGCEKRINELEEENFHQHGEIQELKQTPYMIEMRNEGKKYIDEI